MEPVTNMKVPGVLDEIKRINSRRSYFRVKTLIISPTFHNSND